MHLLDALDAASERGLWPWEIRNGLPLEENLRHQELLNRGTAHAPSVQFAQSLPVQSVTAPERAEAELLRKQLPLQDPAAPIADHLGGVAHFSHDLRAAGADRFVGHFADGARRDEWGGGP